eukprot:13165-Pleurochrysis_carterae.AAC.1
MHAAASLDWPLTLRLASRYMLMCTSVFDFLNPPSFQNATVAEPGRGWLARALVLRQVGRGSYAHTVCFDARRPSHMPATVHHCVLASTPRGCELPSTRVND